MTKAWGVTGEEQFAAYPIMDQLRTSKDYVNQFGMTCRLLFCPRAIYLLFVGRSFPFGFPLERSYRIPYLAVVSAQSDRMGLMNLYQASHVRLLSAPWMVPSSGWAQHTSTSSGSTVSIRTRQSRRPWKPCTTSLCQVRSATSVHPVCGRSNSP